MVRILRKNYTVCQDQYPSGPVPCVISPFGRQFLLSMPFGVMYLECWAAAWLSGLSVWLRSSHPIHHEPNIMVPSVSYIEI